MAEQSFIKNLKRNGDLKSPMTSNLLLSTNQTMIQTFTITLSLDARLSFLLSGFYKVGNIAITPPNERNHSTSGCNQSSRGGEPSMVQWRIFRRPNE